jgi:hypothetical protein
MNGHTDQSFEQRPPPAIEASANGQAGPPAEGPVTLESPPPRPSFDDIEARLAQLQRRLRSAPVAPGGTRAHGPAEDAPPADE